MNSTRSRSFLLWFIYSSLNWETVTKSSFHQYMVPKVNKTSKVGGRKEQEPVTLNHLPSPTACPLAASVQTEEAKSRYPREDHHAQADQDRARYSLPHLVAELPVHVAYLHPLQLRLPNLCEHRGLCRRCHRCQCQICYRLQKKPSFQFSLHLINGRTPWRKQTPT